MNIDQAKEISKIVKHIEHCEAMIGNLDRSYKDEFALNYRGCEICDLEEDVIDLLLKYYNTELELSKKKLEKFK